MKKENLIGIVFGRLTVIEESRKNGELAWKCKCICGGEKVIIPYVLKKGITKSCGCHGR